MANVLINWSGGLDSTLLVLNALANQEYDDIYCTTMNFLNNELKIAILISVKNVLN